MERIQKLKDEAYEIATDICSNGYGEQYYRWSVGVRLDAMRTYAQLVLAENNSTKLMDTNTNL